MSRKSLLFFIGLSSLLACEQPTEPVNWIWYNRGELHQNYNLELKRNNYEFHYGATDSTGIFQTTINVEFNWNERTLKFWEDESCELLDSLTINWNNQSTKVYKFFYDVPDSMDEEAFVYVSRQHGLLATKELAWSGHQLLVNNNKELLTRLENDTTGFFTKSRKYGI